jgi:hypothetical protein
MILVKKFLVLTFVAIGGYIVVANATGFGKAVQAVGGVYNSGVKTLQGRA